MLTSALMWVWCDTGLGAHEQVPMGLPVSALPRVGAPWDPGKERACCVASSAKLKSQHHLFRGADVGTSPMGGCHPAEAAPAGPAACGSRGCGVAAGEGGSVRCALPQKLSHLYVALWIREGAHRVTGWPGDSQPLVTPSPRSADGCHRGCGSPAPAVLLSCRRVLQPPERRQSCPRASPARPWCPAPCCPTEEPPRGPAAGGEALRV